MKFKVVLVLFILITIFISSTIIKASEESQLLTDIPCFGSGICFEPEQPGGGSSHPGETNLFSTFISSTRVNNETLKAVEIGDSIYNTWLGAKNYPLKVMAISTATGQIAINPQAADLLLHFLGNSGNAKINFPVKKMIQNSNSNSEQVKSFVNHINSVLEAAEVLAMENKTRTMYLKKEATVQLSRNDGDNWYLALGNYRIAIKAEIIKTGNYYSAEIIYELRDYYDWHLSSEISVFAIASQGLFELHMQGLARNFHNSGQASLTASWNSGQRYGFGADISWH
ncbi:MAG: hypothetical protein FWE36_03400 [Erysipelotrichales bacterium]|nr:hypothetical protein [Erysipelotrichales bacterium]